MITTRPLSLKFVSLTLAAVVAVAPGCSDRSPNESRSATAPATSSPELTNELLQAFERGLRKEVDAVRAAQQRSRDAKTPQDRGNAIQASFEDATIPEGAAAAGLPVEQYRAVRATVNGILQTLDFQGKIDGPLEMDLSRADAPTKQRLARDAFSGLSPSSAALLQAQLDRLVPVWIEYVNLTAVAG